MKTIIDYNKPIVQIESPFAASSLYTQEQNIEYARTCVRDSILRGEAPFASHLIYTQDGILDDNNAEERLLGIETGLVMLKRSHLQAVYTDFGISSGMKKGIAAARDLGIKVEFRSLCENKTQEF